MKRFVQKDYIISSIIVLILFLVTIICFDITYILNDDMMIESILSGSFSGKASCLSYYLSVPLGFVLMLLYKLIRGVNWLGVFCVCSMITCMYLVLINVMRIREDKKSKMYLVTLYVSGYFALMMETFALPHYTVIAAIYAMTGIFIFILSTEKSKGISSIVCMILCYLVRENVFFMMIPFWGTAFIFKILAGGTADVKTMIRPRIRFIVTFAGLFLIMFCINKIPFLSGEYKEYKDFNADRTLLYDYVGVQENDEARAYYREVGISDDAYEIYKSYNIMLTGSDKYKDIKNMGAYSGDRSTKRSIKEAIYDYRKSLTDKNLYFPYNYMIIGLYVILLALILKYKLYQYFISTGFLLVSRSFLWIYLFYKGRFPERVTFSLMIIEIVTILGMIVILSSKEKNFSLSRLLPMLSILIMLGGAYFGLGKLAKDYERQASINQSDDVLYSYMNEKKDSFFFLDVYATVYHTDYVFKNYDNSFDNYMILGGWMSGHPLVSDKLSSAGIPEEVIDAVKAKETYIVTKKGTGWQKEDYENHLKVNLFDEDTLTGKDGTVFNVYRCWN